MQAKSDAQLLREYAEHGVEAAFSELVTRHTDLVYSAALRQTNSPDAACDVAQRVFMGLAQGASALSKRLDEHASLAGWLCRSTRNLSLNLRRDEFRRMMRERQAMHDLDLTSEEAPNWECIGPLLDQAMSELSDADYDALVLRYFKNLDLRAVGNALGVSDDAAQKRVSRALEKLRSHLAHRGVKTSAAALSVAIASNAVQAAPAGLVAALSTPLILAQATVPAAVAVTAANTIAMTTFQKTLVALVVTAAVGTGIFEARENHRLSGQIQALRERQSPMEERLGQLLGERDEATNRLALLGRELAQLKSDAGELQRLRAEVTQLRAAARASGQMEPVMAAWGARVASLKEKLEQMPDKNIPELQLISEKDWANAAWDADLSTEDGVREALGKLRQNARDNLFKHMRVAFKRYAAANDDALPADLSQLKPHFPVQVDDSMLERYTLVQTGKLSDHLMGTLVKSERIADEDYDSVHEMGIHSGSVARFNKLSESVKEAVEAFSEANKGRKPIEPFQIEPYLKRPMDAATVRKYMNRLENE